MASEGLIVRTICSSLAAGLVLAPSFQFLSVCPKSGIHCLRVCVTHFFGTTNFDVTCKGAYLLKSSITAFRN